MATSVSSSESIDMVEPSAPLDPSATSEVDEVTININTMEPPPPSYNTCEPTVEKPPPAYNSIFGRVRGRMQSVGEIMPITPAQHQRRLQRQQTIQDEAESQQIQIEMTVEEEASAANGLDSWNYTRTPPRPPTTTTETTQVVEGNWVVPDFSCLNSDKCCKWFILGLLGVGLLTGIPIAGMALGFENVDHCPQEPLIPKWMIVMGIGSILVCLCPLLPMGLDGFRGKDHKRFYKDYGWHFNFIAIAILVFLVIWFICGNVFVYRNYNGFYNMPSRVQREKKVYNVDCDKTTYVFAFWWIALCYIGWGVFVVGLMFAG